MKFKPLSFISKYTEYSPVINDFYHTATPVAPPSLCKLMNFVCVDSDYVENHYLR